MKYFNWKLFLFLAAVLFPRVTFGLEISNLNSAESRAINLACPQSTSEDICIRKHLFRLSKVNRIDLSILNKFDQLVLENICETKNVLSKGPANYNKCVTKELSRWKDSDKVILDNMSESDQSELVNHCRIEMKQGLVKFHECLLSTLRRQFQDNLTSKSPPKKTGPESGNDKLPPKVTLPSAQQLFKLLSPSVLMVGAWDHNHVLVSRGSGVAISKSLILTNYHVIKGGDEFRVKNGPFDKPVTIYWSDPEGDMCILRVKAGRLDPVRKFRLYDEIEIGERVYTLGSPVGLENTFAEGMLSGKRTQDGRNYLQTTAPISPGSSGGGLFDAEGRLIGITTFLLEGSDLFFAIPIDSFPSGIRKN